MSKNKTRKPHWAGQFYPANPKKIKDQVQLFLDETDASIRNVFGLVVPHAGYDFSGRIAATAYKTLGNTQVETVYVLAPSHSTHIDGISVFDGDAYETPLGEIRVNKEKSKQLADFSDRFTLSDNGHTEHGSRPEHSLEVQLPFLQMVLGKKFNIVPIIFHDYSWENCKTLGNALAELNDEKSLIVASSDFYHGDSYDDCVETDRRSVEAILEFDAEKYLEKNNNGEIQACGAGPIAALMHAAKTSGCEKIVKLAQTNSADVIGQFGGWTVGYASFVVEKNDQE